MKLVNIVAKAIGDAPYPPRIHVMGELHKKEMAENAIDAVFAYIREQVARDDVVEAGTDCGPIGCCSLQPQEVHDIFTDMLSVIERNDNAS
jgi:hypothetical protein